MPRRIEQSSAAPADVLTLREVAELLIRHKGLHEGLYNAIFQLQIAVGAVGPSRETTFPGGMFGIAGVGLEKVEQAGPHTVDAAIVNPATPATSARNYRRDQRLKSAEHASPLKKRLA